MPFNTKRYINKPHDEVSAIFTSIHNSDIFLWI